MKVAYLVNQYPAVSHSFIRREIVALESLGMEVVRFSLRRPGTLVDPSDVEEAAKTRAVLAGGARQLLVAWIATAFGAPLKWLAVAAAAVRLSRRSGIGIVRHLAYMAEACVLLRWMRAKGGIDHLHAHFGTNSATVAMFTRMLGGPPYSFTAHGPEEFDHPVELSLPEKIERAAAVIAVSDFGRSQLYRWIPYTEWPKVHVVRCGVDAAFLRAGPQPIADTRRLVCVGRLSEQKGQLLILEAAASLATEGLSFELVLAGDGPMRATIDRRIRELGLDGRVRVTGWISNDLVRKELLEARALLLPSFAEGLPVVLMEAFAVGRPAITTFVAGIPELVKDGVSGWLIPAGSVDAMIGAIKAALAATPDELIQMGRAAAAAAAARHDATKEAARLAAIFEARVGRST